MASEASNYVNYNPTIGQLKLDTARLDADASRIAGSFDRYQKLFDDLIQGKNTINTALTKLSGECKSLYGKKAADGLNNFLAQEHQNLGANFQRTLQTFLDDLKDPECNVQVAAKKAIAGTGQIVTNSSNVTIKGGSTKGRGLQPIDEQTFRRKEEEQKRARGVDWEKVYYNGEKDH